MPSRNLSDSDRTRSLLQADVSELKNHEIQLWQFLFGQIPNGKDINPTPTSWCGQISEGIKNIRYTLYFILGTFVAFGLIDNRSAVIEVFKMIGGR